MFRNSIGKFYKLLFLLYLIFHLVGVFIILGSLGIMLGITGGKDYFFFKKLK
jgi:hypothetical protein